jgi:hypothetical protein
MIGRSRLVAVGSVSGIIGRDRIVARVMAGAASMPGEAAVKRCSGPVRASAASVP